MGPSRAASQKVPAGILILLVLLSPVHAAPQESDAAYYPLKLGRSWVYKITSLNPPKWKTSVTWRVNSVARRDGFDVFQVWPTPTDLDDIAMMLRIDRGGVRDVIDNLLLIKFPAVVGQKWTHQEPDRGDGTRGERRFRIASRGTPCRAAGNQYPDCLVIEDFSSATGLRTRTSYAKGVGPVTYEYFRSRNGGETALSIVELEAVR